MLSSYRVLDLTDQRGMLCGYILAHLGADVIAAEQRDDLWWRAYARGKKSAALDLESEAGRARFTELVADTDFLIESFAPDRARRLNLDYETLAAVNPGLILISITPFGRSLSTQTL